MAARYNPYGLSHGSGQRGALQPRGALHRGRGYGRSFRGHRHHFNQQRSFTDDRFLPSMNVPPPKPIPTVQFAARSPIQQHPRAQPYNFVANWLAVNPISAHRKRELIVIDESSTEQSGSLEDMQAGNGTGVTVEKKARINTDHGGAYDSQDISIIEEKPSNSMQQSVQQRPLERPSVGVEVIDITDSDDECVVVSPVKQMQDWSSDGSCQTTSSLLSGQICDGFSKYCKFNQLTGRNWEVCEEASLQNQRADGQSSTFTVCSYNVLCQKTMARTSYLYGHLYGLPQFSDWDHRWKGLSEELQSFNSDILGLQEVQAEHFVENFEPLMKKLKYRGHYKRKSGTDLKDDGCALFYKPTKFEELKYTEVDYFVAPTAISNRENIGQILALRCRLTDEVILVANTHLLFNTERGDVKLAQLAILFSHIDKMRKELKDYNPLIMVMGDFNMEVNSSVYNFVINGNLRIDNEPVRTMSGQSRRPGGILCNARRLLENTVYCMDSTIRYDRQRPIPDGHIRHPFKFSSAYHQNADYFEKRPISTFHKDAAAPDFIFFSRDSSELGVDRLQLIEKYALPSYATLYSTIPWPNEHTPSDHIPLIAKFALHKA